MRHRVFVSITFSPQLQEQAAAWRQQHKLPVRWMGEKNLHVTLLPPWYEEEVEKVKRAFATLPKQEVFDIAFNRITYGPDPEKPRLIWAIGEAPDKLRELQAAAADALGVKPTFKLALAHATLARFREEDFKNFSVKRLDEHVDWRMRVTSVTLMESRLTEEGADYDILETIDFA